MKNILILGSGGREHAFAWKIAQSPRCNKLFIAPGNAGTAHCGTNVALNPNDFPAIQKFVSQQQIDLILVGPEEPLVRGIYDYFEKEAVQVVGPSKEGARLEGSKAYAKAFMDDYNIPTAAYQEFSKETIEEGLAYIASQTPPIVLKADGLAAGKGVLILENIETAQTEFKAMLNGKFGTASERIVVEEFLSGIEFSVFVLTDGEDYKVLPVAKDYKRIGEGDKGLNTGGMGAVSPVPFVDEALMQKVDERIIQPSIKGLKDRGITYKGFVFIGLILVNSEPYVIEYNCRMGDPETEAVMPRLQNDLLDLLLALDENSLSKKEIQKDPRSVTTIMLVSGGYPEAYEKGKVIQQLESVNDSLIFHAGTKEVNNKILTNGGRVIAISSYGNNMKEALAKSNKNADVIQFEGKNYRKDIGFDL